MREDWGFWAIRGGRLGASQGTYWVFLQRQQATLGYQSDRQAKHLPNQSHGRLAAGMFHELSEGKCTI